MKTKNLLLVLALFFLLTSPTTAMLTPSGKDWLAVHAGSADCYQPSGILYTDADGISHTGPTGDVANALYVAHLVGKDTVPITSDGKNYNDFKAANGGNDMVITDVGWVYDNDGGAGEPQHCVGVIPTPTPTPTPTPVPVFDTSAPSNPYPSIFGTHNGTIKPNQTITVFKMYTYPCAGTGGHTEYARIWNSSWGGVEAHWKGYVGNWHNISFNKTFTLVANETYNYTICTGSYPQIIHKHIANVTGGTITCTEFTDANGRRYEDWIPAIRLEHTMPEIDIAFVIFNETDDLSKYTEQALSFVNQHIPATFEAITVRLPEATEFTYWGTGEDRCCFLAGWNVRSMGHEEQLPLACLGYFLLWKFKEGDKPCWGGGTWGPIHGLNNKRISSAPYNAWWWSEPGWRPDMPGGTCIILHELHHMIGGTLVDDYKYYKGADSMSEHRYGETIPNIDRMSDFGFTDDYNFTAWCYEQLTEEMCKKLEMIYKNQKHSTLGIKRPPHNSKAQQKEAQVGLYNQK